jgi:DNA invertase Pin-like site-specific DNA recombinase
MTPKARQAQKCISYLRVSTQRQGIDGLGMDAQRKAVEEYMQREGWLHVGEYVEVESGRNSERPELAKAVKACRLRRARLVVAKLDRLARSAAFLLTLRDTLEGQGVEVAFADLPNAEPFTVGILAMVAEYEAQQISKRTKAALAAAKARGQVLGTPKNLRNQEVGRSRAAAVRRARADGWARDMEDLVTALQMEGITSLAGIAKGLTEAGWPTPAGHEVWNKTQVRRLLQRLDKRGVS